jgi:hypothetical protein
MKKKDRNTPTAKDLLSSRPDGELPTTLDPAGPEARGYPADPKCGPPREKAADAQCDPKADDYSA